MNQWTFNMNWQEIKDLLDALPKNPKPEARDLRGRVIEYIDGERVRYEPAGKLDRCFEVENISWSFTGIERATGKPFDFKTASASREREFRKEHQNEYIFS